MHLYKFLHTIAQAILMSHCLFYVRKGFIIYARCLMSHKPSSKQVFYMVIRYAENLQYVTQGYPTNVGVVKNVNFACGFHLFRKLNLFLPDFLSIWIKPFHVSKFSIFGFTFAHETERYFRWCYYRILIGWINV